MHRRDLFKSSAALAALLGLPGITRAATNADHKLILVWCSGGWDPTMSLAPMFDTGVAMEFDATEATVRGLPIVDHANRPSVRNLFQTYGDRATIFNGILVPSIAHDACTKLMMTGSTDDGRSDWGAIVGSTAMDRLMPHLSIQGPNFGGSLAQAVVPTGQGGQLGELVDGSAVRAADGNLSGISPAASDAVDRALTARAAARDAASRTDLERQRTGAFIGALDRLMPLRYIEDQVPLGSTTGMSNQMAIAVDALAAGVSRSAMISDDGFYDSHANNFATQSGIQEGLFGRLRTLLDDLASRAGENGGTLLDETTVVVMSEMGRTPLLNADQGKDHWPFTSALVLGAGFQGGRVIGAYNTAYEGRGVNKATGEVDDGSPDLTSAVFGATLLASMNVDPGEFLPGADPITGALA